MIVAKSIPWEPIGAMPEDRKDGRDLLLWAADISGAEIAAWNDGVWVNRSGFTIRGVSYWADILPPE